MSNNNSSGNGGNFDKARRNFLRGLGIGTAVAVAQPAWGGQTFQDAFASFFQKDYRRMSDEEIEAALERIERKAQDRYDVAIDCQNTPPQPGVVYGYAINISRCKGYRDCVHACVKENNLGRDSQMQYIRVLQLDQGDFNLRRQCRSKANTICRFSACSVTTRPASRPARSRQPGWSPTVLSSSTTTGVSAAATAWRLVPTGRDISTGPIRKFRQKR